MIINRTPIFHELTIKRYNMQNIIFLTTVTVLFLLSIFILNYEFQKEAAFIGLKHEVFKVCIFKGEHYSICKKELGL